MNLETIKTAAAPAAVGPYSQAVKAGDWLFCSGQIGLNPNDGKLVPGGVEAETRQALANLDAVLQAAGLNRQSVVKTTVFMTDMKTFPTMNAVYAAFFMAPFPARSTVQAGALPKGACVEIEAVAHG